MRYPIIVLMAFLAGCIGSNESQPENDDRYNTFVQIAIPNHPGIMQIREAVTPKINAIIKEELQVPDGVDFPDFIIPSWQRKASRLTLYYLNDLKKDNESYILDAFDQMQQQNRGIEIGDNLSIAAPVNFFGDKKQYIVFTVSDPNGSLGALNKDIKEFARQAQAHYKEEKQQDLYDIGKSERFDYSPHIALGRFMPEYFSKFVDGLSEEKQFRGGTLEEKEKNYLRVRERVKKEVFPIIYQMLKSVPTNLDIRSFCMYGHSEERRTWRVCKKEYPLKVAG